MKQTTLLSIRQAAARGVERVRLPDWGDPMDHLKIDIIGGKPGPWLHMFCPQNESLHGRDPVPILWGFGWKATSIDVEEYQPYNGPLPGTKKYQDKADEYRRVRDSDG